MKLKKNTGELYEVLVNERMDLTLATLNTQNLLSQAQKYGANDNIESIVELYLESLLSQTLIDCLNIDTMQRISDQARKRQITLTDQRDDTSKQTSLDTYQK